LNFVLATTAPALTATLKNDTGASATDGITNDDTVAGAAAAPSDAIATLKGGFYAASGATFVDLTSSLTAGRTLVLDPALLQQVAGGTLVDGAHTLHLVATDQAGNTKSFDLSFTLKTTAPSAPTFALSPSNQSAALGANVTAAASAAITGQTDANITVTLKAPDGTTLQTVSDNQGHFQFNNVGLAVGANALTATATDIAGNAKTFSLTIQRTAQAPTGDAALQWDAATLNAIA